MANNDEPKKAGLMSTKVVPEKQMVGLQRSLPVSDKQIGEYKE